MRAKYSAYKHSGKSLVIYSVPLLIIFMAKLICYETFISEKWKVIFRKASIPLSHLLKYAKLPINQTDN